jgi:hypothetical protein
MINCNGFERKWSWPYWGSILEFPRSTEKDREEPQSGTLMLRSWFKPSTTRIQVKSITATLTRSVLYIFVSNGLNTRWWFLDSSNPSFATCMIAESALGPPDLLPSCSNRCSLDVSERGNGFIISDPYFFHLYLIDFLEFMRCSYLFLSAVLFEIF